MNATPAKLKDGSWGARVQGAAKAGDAIIVTTRGGKSWQAVVEAVLWSGDGATLVRTKSNRQDSQLSITWTSGTDMVGHGHGNARKSRGCSCNEPGCCRPCRCESHCNCRGGNIYDCG